MPRYTQGPHRYDPAQDWGRLALLALAAHLNLRCPLAVSPDPNSCLLSPNHTQATCCEPLPGPVPMTLSTVSLAFKALRKRPHLGSSPDTQGQACAHTCGPFLTFLCLQDSAPGHLLHEAFRVESLLLPALCTFWSKPLLPPGPGSHLPAPGWQGPELALPHPGHPTQHGPAEAALSKYMQQQVRAVAPPLGRGSLLSLRQEEEIGKG